MLDKLKMDLKSWRTTILGIIAGLVVILPQIAAMIDGDPATEFSMKILIGGFALMGIGIAAKDGDKSTKDVK